MKMKKIIATMLLMAVSVIGVGCSNNTSGSAEQQNPAQEKPANETNAELTLGMLGSVDVIPFVIAEEMEYFDKAGVDVEIELFKSAKDRDAALQAGALDGIICDEVAIAIYQNSGLDMKITGVTDGAFILVTGPNSSIQTIEDLKGKKVAISEKTAIEFSLDKLLEQNGMVATDVVKEIVPVLPTRLEMLRNGQVDAALLPDPFASVMKAENANVLGQMDPSNMYISVMAFKQDMIEQKEDLIKKFYVGYNEAVDYLNSTNITEYEDLVMEVVGYPEDMRGNIVLPTFRKNTLPTAEELQQVIDWSKANGLLEIELTPGQMLSHIAVQ